MRYIVAVIGVLSLCVSGYCEIIEQNVEYTHGDVVLQGYFAYDDSSDAKRPGILVVHDWSGLQDYPKLRARELAQLGYVAFALDMYGKDIRPKNREESAHQAGIYRADRALMRERAKAGLAVLSEHPLVDKTRIAAIGYCFGGGVVLELARSGAEINGVVSFHGNLDTPNPDDAKNIRTKVLVLHGAADPHVPDAQVQAFLKEMHGAEVDFQMVFYGNAVHSFSKPDAGDDPSTGVAYDKSADRRSWLAMRNFFSELFEMP
jgi:dienelactone hydrolase